MPEPDRLASTLFQVAPIHSPTGPAVLHDMMALYQRRSEAEYWPILEPDKCCCQKDNPKRRFDDPTTSYDWTHIYTCYKGNRCDVYDFPSSTFSVMSGLLAPKPGSTTTKVA
jgi:hypothetical protein